MNQIQATVQAFLPPKRKNTPSGWISFNAPCCIHNGERVDTRQRGGMLFNNDGFQYHCFNCNFKAGWQPGKLLSKNTKKILTWLGVPEIEVQKLNLEALKNKEDLPKAEKVIDFNLVETRLPDDCRPLVEWIKNPEGYDEEIFKTVEYLISRGIDIDWYPWHWSAENGYRDRVIIPFYYQGKVVGYTGRKITDGKPKYLTDAQPGYVFNLDRQHHSRKYVIVVEGQFDAISVDGVAIMHNEPNSTQIARINALGKDVILVPDYDKPGAKMIDAALSAGWSVSCPPWAERLKDSAKAVEKYGRLYTLSTILHYRETNEIKIQLLKKKLEALHG